MSWQVDLQQECTIYVRNFDENVNEKLLEELFTQVGPVNYVIIRDPHKSAQSVDATPKTTANRYAFVEFADVESVLFACEMMDAIELYGQKLKVQPRDNTVQRSLFTQLNMHTASWERHHSVAAVTPRNSTSVQSQFPIPLLNTSMPVPIRQQPQSSQVDASCFLQGRGLHYSAPPMRHSSRTPSSSNLSSGQNFGERRSMPYFKDRGHPYSRESGRRKSNR